MKETAESRLARIPRIIKNRNSRRSESERRMSTTATREKPILMSGPMVRSILAGRKTQTRRVVKLSDPTQTYAVHDDDEKPGR